jgi:hypothetical protein
MARYTKSPNGKYQIHGKSYHVLTGTRAQVWHGTAYKTTGDLTKNNFLQNKSGRIVSSKKSASAKRDNRLVKSGYGTKKGKFGWVKIGSRRHHSKRRSRRSMRGGMNSSSSSTSNHGTTSDSSSSTSMQDNLKAMMQQNQGGSSTSSSHK